MTKTLQEIVEENHIGYGGSLGHYKDVCSTRDITDVDIKWIEDVLAKASSSQYGYDMFPDEGGIDIADYLLEEVKKLKGIDE